MRIASPASPVQPVFVTHTQHMHSHRHGRRHARTCCCAFSRIFSLFRSESTRIRSISSVRFVNLSMLALWVTRERVHYVMPLECACGRGASNEVQSLGPQQSDGSGGGVYTNRLF